MQQGKQVFGAAVGLALLMGLPAQAFDGNAEKGKQIFMTMGKNDKACMTCHPKGLTTGKTYKGDDIPELTDEISERKMTRKTKRFLRVQGTQLTDAELNDLLTFVQRLPSKGFGPVPREWQAHVKKTLGQ